MKGPGRGQGIGHRDDIEFSQGQGYGRGSGRGYGQGFGQGQGFGRGPGRGSGRGFRRGFWPSSPVDDVGPRYFGDQIPNPISGPTTANAGGTPMDDDVSSLSRIVASLETQLKAVRDRLKDIGEQE